MNSMRCGKNTEDKAVFCPECREEMSRYPVKPGTLVHIPTRPAPDTRKPARKKKDQTLEEQLASAQQVIKGLLVTVLCLMLGLIICGIMLVMSMGDAVEQPEETQSPRTRNYTIVEPAED